MNDSLQRVREAYNLELFSSTAHSLVDQLAQSLEKAISRKTDEVIPWLEASEFWQKGIHTEESDPLQLFQSVAEHTIRLHHPRYLGHQIAPVIPHIALAGLFTQSLNNGMGIYEMGMAGTIMERYVLDTLAKSMGLGENSSGILTSGGTLANLTALLAARQIQADHDIWEEGYQDGERFALMVSAEAHYSVQRAAKIMGWGEGGIIKIPVDEKFRLDSKALAPALAQARIEGRKVVAVVGSCCSTATGSFDPLDKIADFCEENTLWFHVDAAHGGPAAFSSTHRDLIKGIERADSVLMDFHKMALCPAVCTALLFKEGQNSYQTFAQKAAYLWEDPAETEWFNLGKRTFECTKHMISLAPFILFKQFGSGLLGDYVDCMFSLGKTFANLIRAKADFELLLEPACNIICFRYRPGNVKKLNTLNRRIRSRMRDEGRFYIVQTEIEGKVYLRCALMNPFTEEKDLKELLDEIVKIAGEL